ncbi:hypothetical protein [Pseudomonas sp. SJZ079]
MSREKSAPIGSAVLMGGADALVVSGLWIRLFPPLGQRDRMHND